MKRVSCLLSVLLSLSIGTLSARAHGGCWGGHGFCGWGGGCWPSFSVGICGFGVSFGCGYPSCGYGYSYPAYAAYPAYTSPYTAAPAAYSQPVYQSAPAAYSQPVYTYRTVQTARRLAATPVYARVQPTVSRVSANIAPTRSNGQAGPADTQLSSGVQDVLKLNRAQVGTSVIQSFVRNSSTGFNLTAAEIVYLHSEGVSDEVIGSMLARKQAAGVVPSNARPTPSVAVN